MSAVQDHVLSRFLTLYNEPKTDNLEAFFDEYERALGHFPAEVLRRAANRVIDDQVFKAWPTPGECRKAAEYVAQLMPKPVPTQAELDKQAEKWPAPSEESKARVRSLVELAKQNLRKPVGDIPANPNLRRGLTETSKRITGEAAE
ncbi:protein of unknown function [Hyphomicrobium sp. 1Nfss2.1]|uniref:hypothetical protein n=1 Tax=Hyphomicrobium sp. 1Nfss2.1 TaxID=3413936 RepID=UPI003C7BE6CD